MHIKTKEITEIYRTIVDQERHKLGELVRAKANLEIEKGKLRRAYHFQLTESETQFYRSGFAAIHIRNISCKIEKIADEQRVLNAKILNQKENLEAALRKQLAIEV